MLRQGMIEKEEKLKIKYRHAHTTGERASRLSQPHASSTIEAEQEATPSLTPGLHGEPYPAEESPKNAGQRPSRKASSIFSGSIESLPSKAVLEERPSKDINLPEEQP